MLRICWPHLNPAQHTLFEWHNCGQGLNGTICGRCRLCRWGFLLWSVYETALLEVTALCSECAAHDRHGRLAWSPAGFLNVCRQLLHRAHKDALWVLGLAEHLLHTVLHES